MVKKYRIKTEQEFILEYGHKWKGGKVRRGFFWNDKMDYLFGKDIGYLDLESCKNIYGIIKKLPSIDDWSISSDMITVAEPSYEPRKSSREI